MTDDSKLKLIEYLPAIYREEKKTRDFLERFLSIFESGLYDIEQVISGISRYFDPRETPDDFVPYLAQWLSLDLYELLEERNREFILHAVEFYKQKGTPQGLVNLVSFLTSRDCCVKEFMNNVFRSYGMEHDPQIYNENQTTKEKCREFYHKTSKTVDTRDRDLLSKMHTHLGYEDEVHYVYDSSISGKYARNVIGLYIFINSSEDEFKFEKEQLHKIIKTFLPVFVRLEIFIVEMIDYYEQYPLSSIIEEYQDRVKDTGKEEIKPLTGVYIDQVNWHWFITNDTAKGLTNNKQYRTPHNGIGVEILF